VEGAILHNYVDLDNPKQVFPEGVKVDFFNEKGEITSTLTAKTATREQKKGIVTCRDSVILQTVKNERLETEELIWNENEQRLNTNKFVKVSKPDEVIYGFGLEADQDFTYWRILVPKGKLKAGEIKE
jgi:LPS export ABC transporter protein LptC